MHRGRSELAGLHDGFGQRDEMKHHAEIRGVERDLAQDFRGAGERDQRIEQSRSVTNQRNAQPDQSHHSLILYFLVLPQAGLISPPRLGDYSLPGGGGAGNGGGHRGL